MQLGTHLGRVLTLDLGYSYRQRRPVLDLILERLPATLLLTLTAFCLALLIGTTLGALAGLAAGSIVDTLFTVLSLLLYATPVFWLGLMLVLVFSVTLGWLPPFGYETINVKMTAIERVFDIMQAHDHAGHVARRDLSCDLRPPDALLDHRGIAPGFHQDGAGQGPRRRRASSSATCCATRWCRS